MTSISRAWRLGVAGLGLALVGAVLVPGQADAAGGVVQADICLPQLPPRPPICIPDPGLPGNPGDPGLPVPTTPPTLVTPTSIGDPTAAKTGATLTAIAPTWKESDVVTSYQWERAGTPISGATMATYEVQAADVGKALTVVGTGTRSFSGVPLPVLTTASESTAANAIEGDAPEATTKPTITPTGPATVGDELSVDSGEWGEGGKDTDKLEFSYQWYRSKPGGAEKIAGATETTYTPDETDAGRALIVLVTAAWEGYEDGAAVSTVVAVPKYASTVALRLNKSKISRKGQVTATVQLGASDGAPSGKVVFYDRRHKVATTMVATSASGRQSVKLPAFKTAGKHPLKAVYVGNLGHKKATSSVVLVKVTKK